VIVVGNESWSSKPNICADDPLKFDNIMYTVHFYAKTAFNIPDCQYAIDKGLALFFTEWGTTTYTGQGGHDYVSGQKWVDFMNGHQQSWTTFNFGTWDPVGAKPPDDCSSFFIGVDNNGPWTEEQITPDAKWKRDRTPF
jgi:endoglucanase